MSNLELCTQTENVNHGHNNNLYTYDLQVEVIDLVKQELLVFRSIREFARYINKSLNYTKTRIKASKYYPNKEVYQGGVTFSLKEIGVIRKRPVIAFRGRDDLWKTLAAN